MKPRDRIVAALSHEIPDRIPRFEIWIDALVEELGQEDEPSTYVNMGQDCVMKPSFQRLFKIPPSSTPCLTIGHPGASHCFRRQYVLEPS